MYLQISVPMAEAQFILRSSTLANMFCIQASNVIFLQSSPVFWTKAATMTCVAIFFLCFVFCSFFFKFWTQDTMYQIYITILIACLIYWHLYCTSILLKCQTSVQKNIFVHLAHVVPLWLNMVTLIPLILSYFSVWRAVLKFQIVFQLSYCTQSIL